MTVFIKTTLLLLAVTSLVACGGKEQKEQPEAVYESERGETAELSMSEKTKLGEKIFTGKGNCTTCHLADKKLIGPSMQDIVKGYDAKGADLDAFLRGKGDAIIEPAQFSMMEANLTLTKKLSAVEMESLIIYMRSL